MKFTITVSSAFTAKHWHDKTLSEPVHEHHFKYEATLQGPLNAEGYLVDFRQLEAALAQTNSALEGRVLNDIMPYPTTENLAAYIFKELAKKFPQTVKIMVREKENYYASCEV